MELEAGLELGGRYVVERHVGGGAMGTVYAVRHQDLGSLFALKILRITGDPRKVAALQARLLTEGRIQASLRHRNVVSVTDVVVIDGQPALVMEWVDGPTLESFIRQRAPLSLSMVQAIGAGVIRGVRAAHKAGHLHRDLKPENVLMANEDGEWIPKVADFGLAKVLSDDGHGSESTVHGAVFGTAQYMSPEQAIDSKDVDARTDVFSLGCVLYELLTGARAFEGASRFEIQTRIAAGRYKPVMELRPDAPQHLVTAIHGALAPDRGKRVGSTELLLDVWNGEADFEVASMSGSLAQLFGWASVENLGPPPVSQASSSAGPPPSITTLHDERVAAATAPPTDVRLATWRVGALVLGIAGGTALGGALLVTLGGFGWMYANSSGTVPVPPADPIPAAVQPAPPPQVPDAGGEPAKAPSPAKPQPARSSRPRPGAVPRAEEPTPQPAVVAPTMDPGPTPLPSPQPSAASTTMVLVDGDAVLVQFQDRDGRVHPVPYVPPGTYAVFAAFQEGEPPSMRGRVTVEPNRTTTVVCSKLFATCKIAR